jgi:hypothetical protein
VQRLGQGERAGQFGQQTLPHLPQRGSDFTAYAHQHRHVRVRSGAGGGRRVQL